MPGRTLFRETARLMGSRRTDRKALAARENGKRGGRPLLPLERIACTCGAGDGPGGHTSRCRRGRAIRRRA
jgi:hypothetical protein